MIGLFWASLAGLTWWNATHSPSLTRSREAERTGKFAAAVRESLVHLRWRPWSQEAARRAGRCLSRLDFAEEAEPYYARALRLTREDRHIRAYGLVRANQRDRALAAYDAILKRDPTDVSALQLKAGVLLSMSRWTDVVAVGQKLAEIPEGPFEVLKPITAGEDWALWPSKLPSAPVVGYSLQGLGHHDNQDSKPAVDAFLRVLELDPELNDLPISRAMFWSMLASDLLSLGRADAVIGYLEKVPEASNDADLMHLLARAYYLKSSLDEAERLWGEILLIRPDHTPSLLNLGRLELNRDHAEEAVGYLEKAAALSPRSYETAYSLSMAYQRLGREEESKQMREKSDALRRELNVQPRGMGSRGGPADPAMMP